MKDSASLQGRVPVAAGGAHGSNATTTQGSGSGSVEGGVAGPAGAEAGAEAGAAAFSALNPGMAFMMERYEEELKRPIRNLVNGQLLRTILIQARTLPAATPLHDSAALQLAPPLT
jgi:hypothetical protein